MFWGASPEPDSRNMAGKSPARACPRTFGRVNVPGGSVWVFGRFPASHACACVSSVSGRMASPHPRCLAVWPLDSGRVASGLSPHGVASFVHPLGWGSGETRVEWSAIYPVPAPIPVPEPQWCPMCLHPAGLRLPSWRAFMVLSLHWWLRATSHGGRRRKCDVRYWIRQSVGAGLSWTGSGSTTDPPPRSAYLNEERRRRR